MAVLGVDFGTSNSAAAVAWDGKAHMIALEKGETTLPTAVFFDFDRKAMLIGGAAGAALLAGEEGRYMRALKSILGAPLMREKRNLLGEKLDFIDVIARFLGQVKAAAEAQTGERYDRALSGRPVRFHPDDARNAQAEVDLREAYVRAGFDDVAFMYEPEAAALANRAVLGQGDLGLIVDIGGGTSDFTLFRNRADSIDILGSHGVRLGGTDFDRMVSLETVMPLLGRGTQIRHAFGSETHTAPATIFNDLATWQKIPFLYAPDSRRLAKDLLQYAAERDKLERLISVLEDELGHDIAFAVEAGKIAANNPLATAPPEIRLDMLERGLRLPLPAALLAATLATMAQNIADVALSTVAQADTQPQEVTKLIYVGGSSLMTIVSDTMVALFPNATHSFNEVFAAVTNGLAIASGRR